MMKKPGKSVKKMPPSFPPAKPAPKFRPTFDSRRFEDMKLESDGMGSEKKVKSPKKLKF